jgi:hypothetical protein
VFQSLRAEEDWSVLRGRTRRAGHWEELKFIPLGESSYLSFGGDARERYEGYRNEGFGGAVKDSNGYHQHRFFFHGDLHLGSRWRMFVQVKGAEQWFRKGVRRANDVDHLDLHQGFVEFGEGGFRVRAGRQELLLGSTRLTGVREGPNVRITFDAVRAIVRPSRVWRVDVFAAHPVLTNAGIFEDRREHERTFWGIYSTRRIRDGSRLSWDVYYFGLDRKNGVFHRGRAREQRTTFGARVWMPIRENSLDIDFELVGQSGRFGTMGARGWYAATETGYTFARLRLRPRIALKANAASGDRGKAALNTYSGLFPDTRDFREQAFPGPQNVTLARPYVEWRLPVAGRRTATLTTACDWYWRSSVRDGLYSFSGVPYPETGQSSSRFVGAKPAVVAVVPLNRHWTAQAIYANLMGSRYVKESYAGQSPAYAALVLFLRF